MSTFAASSVVGREPRAHLEHRRAQARPQLARGVGERLLEGLLHARPCLAGELAHARAVEQVGLQPLDARDHRRVVLQVVGELGEVAVDRFAERMPRVLAHRAHEREHLAVRAVVDEPVDEPGQPARQPVGDHVAERLGVRLEPSFGLLEHHVDRSPLLVGGDEARTDATDRGRPLGLEQVPPRELLDDVLDVIVAEQRQHTAGGDGCLCGEPLGIRGCREPAAEPPGDADRTQLAEHDLVGEELVLDERAERRADLVLARRDDRRVRDLQPERIPEQRGHREPVRDRADHRALGRRTHVAEPRQRVLQGERHREHDGRGEQQPGGDPLHAPERRQPLRIGRQRRRDVRVVAAQLIGRRHESRPPRLGIAVHFDASPSPGPRWLGWRA